MAADSERENKKLTQDQNKAKTMIMYALIFLFGYVVAGAYFPFPKLHSPHVTR